MIDQFRTVYRGGTGEIVEKKSRFIATVRCSDDGEPSGTAGRPMRDVVQGAGLRNVLVVVTR